MAKPLQFSFCPETRVAETIAPDEPQVRDFNGWDYTPTPVLPYRRRFKVTLEGLKWYMGENGFMDITTDGNHNAGLLESFYGYHRRHVPFIYPHEWMGELLVRFDSNVNVPKAIPNSGGLIDAFEIQLIHHNPSY